MWYGERERERGSDHTLLKVQGQILIDGGPTESLHQVVTNLIRDSETLPENIENFLAFYQKTTQDNLGKKHCLVWY